MRLNKWKYLFKAYFNYTVKEQRAIVVLMIVISLLQVALIVLHWVPVNGKSRNHLSSQVIVSNDKSNIESPTASTTNIKIKLTSIKLFSFNPNTNSISDWIKLGLSEKQGQSIVKYISKGGSFKVKDDLKKMHVIKPNLLHQWWNYILLPEKLIEKSERSDQYSIKQKDPLNKQNINTASIEDLDKLPLIGEGRAKAIISYRERLGGFIAIDQLLEIKCIPDSVFQVLQSRITTDGKINHALNINGDSLFHPYLPKSFAKMIVSYRQQHGNYQRIEDLRILPLYDDKIIRKIAPYLTVKP
jgi:competence ComEA-like helix-hairpin-helix protein